MAVAIAASYSPVEYNGGASYMDKITYPEQTSVESIEQLLQDKPVVFVEATQEALCDNLGELITTQDNTPNVNESTLSYKYYFKGNSGILSGSIYTTQNDTPETIAALKTSIYEQAEDGTLLNNYNDDKNYLSNLEVVKGYVQLFDTDMRTVSCVYNNEVLGSMTDYQNYFVLNSPNNQDYAWVVITHEVFLSPTSSSNRYYKGVGLEITLNNARNFNVRDYAPLTQASNDVEIQYRIIPSDTSLADDSQMQMHYFRMKTPSITNSGSVANNTIDTKYNYYEPGSWYGDICQYNSNQTTQNWYSVLMIDKTSSQISYSSQVKGRFQKYQNWPFPWVDEYFTIDTSNVINVSDIISAIDNAN
jgi:hypothetical protein